MVHRTGAAFVTRATALKTLFEYCYNNIVIVVTIFIMHNEEDYTFDHRPSPLRRIGAFAMTL